MVVEWLLGKLPEFIRDQSREELARQIAEENDVDRRALELIVETPHALRRRTIPDHPTRPPDPPLNNS